MDERERTGSGIAIVGMAGRFPGAADVERFWENLAAGIESVTFFGREELLAAGVDPAQLDDPAYVPARAALDGAELFDAELFGYSPREAEILDPQHRLLPGVRLGGPGARRLRPAALRRPDRRLRRRRTQQPTCCST